jgi:hypothetical protein
MILFILLFMLSLVVGGCQTPPVATGTRDGASLKQLAIYYGWPSVFDGARSIEEAVAKLEAYQVLVLGWGLQRSDHGDHEKTRQLIGKLGRRVEVYGYISLGTASDFAMDQIKRAVKAWKRLGADGIFFDEAGYDFGNTRRRQNDALSLCHRHRLRAFVNAFDPAHLFAWHQDPQHNPKGQKIKLQVGDSYLYESFGLRLGQPEPEQDREQKMAKLAAARSMGIRIFGVTTSPSSGFFDKRAWSQVVELALRHGLDGLGWGEHQFAAQDNLMPLRAIPR